MTVQRILSWQINSINQERQEVLRSIDGGPDIVIATLSATDTSYVDNEDFAMTTGVAYQVASIATINGVESRAVSETISTPADGNVIKFTPYTFKSAGTTLSADSLEAFTITTNGTEYPSVFDEATSKWKLTNVVVTTTDDISITSVATPKQYSSVINITTPISEIVSWSEFDWGSNEIRIKPDLTKLVKVPTAPPVTSTFKNLFKGALIFNDPSVNQWNTSHVTDMSYMFRGARQFNQPLNSWNTAKVTDMSGMFYECYTFNQPLSHFNTSLVLDMRNIFLEAKVFNQDIGMWDVSKVTTMSTAFCRAYAFAGLGLQNWNTSAVTDMSYMFQNASVFNQPIGNWNTTSVTNMGNMFLDALAFNQPIGDWDVSNVTNMENMFQSYGTTTKFNQPIGSWNVSKVTNMGGMFSGRTYYAQTVFNQDLSQWCVASILSEPVDFTTPNSALSGINKPVWGTCPRGENILP